MTSGTREQSHEILDVTRKIVDLMAVIALTSPRYLAPHIYFYSPQACMLGPTERLQVRGGALTGQPCAAHVCRRLLTGKKRPIKLDVRSTLRAVVLNRYASWAAITTSTCLGGY